MQHHYAKVGFGIEFYRTNRNGFCPDGLIEMSTPPPIYDWVAKSDGSYLEVLPSDAEICQQCKQNLATKRYEVAGGGVVIDGVNLQSDADSSNEMSKYVTESIVNDLVSVNWKLADGSFVVYTVQQFKKIYQIVAKYRNDCFGVEMSKQAEIDAAQDPTTVDIETGWPVREFTTV